VLRGHLILLRHGQSVSNARGCFAESDEAPITERGRDQARAAAAHIAQHFEPLRLIASPMQRARQTAEILASQLQLPVEIEPELREREVGGMRGQPYEAMRCAAEFDARRPWLWRPPAGESLLDVQARAVRVLRVLLRKHAGDDVVIVSHQGTILAVWAWATGDWEQTARVPNGAALVVPHDGDTPLAPRLVALPD
jgi:broad specificity phosphatase PhoE